MTDFESDDEARLGVDGPDFRCLMNYEQMVNVPGKGRSTRQAYDDKTTKSI